MLTTGIVYVIVVIIRKQQKKEHSEMKEPNYRRIEAYNPCCGICQHYVAGFNQAICTREKVGVYEDEYGCYINVYEQIAWNYICDNFNYKIKRGKHERTKGSTKNRN